MIGAIAAGIAAGFVLGLLGAGGTIVGLPFLLYLVALSPHRVLGTNALGVAFAALALLAVRIWRRRLPLAPGLTFALPGLVGIYLGGRLGLTFPGRQLVFLLGFLVFVVAAWMFYLSTRSAAAPSQESFPLFAPLTRQRVLLLAPTALVVGAVAGFFAIGGGFLIVPALMLVGGLELAEAAAAALVPIAAFALLVGAEYASSGQVAFGLAVIMALAGLIGGLFGIGLGARLPKKRLQQVFALLLVAIGIYMLAR